MINKILFLICGLLTTTITLAQTEKFADPAIAVGLPESGASSMGKVTVALMVILMLLFAAAWMMRQFKLFGRSGQAEIEVMQGISLGHKERAVLIKVQNRRLLIGVAPGCVNLLMELSPDDAVERCDKPSVIVPKDVNAPSFKTLLKRSMGIQE
ncbi:MAG: flagellar biosynthetic protein FliO [Steroidobacteraceae bacterium]